MAEEEKEVVTEEKPETNEPTEKIDSAEGVVTEPQPESENTKVDVVQLEQRISSLEQRLQSLEESNRSSEQSSDPNFEDKTQPTEVEDDQEPDGIESSDEIKKMLNL